MAVNESFNPRSPVYVTRVFKSSGRQYNVGDRFDWDQRAISQRRVRQLFDKRMLTHEASVPSNENESGGVTPPDSTPSLPAVSTSMLLKDLQDIAESEGAPLKGIKSDQVDAINDNREK